MHGLNNYKSAYQHRSFDIYKPKDKQATTAQSISPAKFSGVTNPQEALNDIMSSIPCMNKDEALQALKCLLREMKGERFLDNNHKHNDLTLVDDNYKFNTSVNINNCSKTEGIGKPRGAVVQLFALCVQLGDRLHPQLKIVKYKPQIEDKLNFISEVLKHPNVSKNSAFPHSLLITHDELSAIFNEFEQINLNFREKSYLDDCQIESNSGQVKISSMTRSEANLDELLDSNNFSKTIKDHIIGFFKDKKPHLDLSRFKRSNLPSLNSLKNLRLFFESVRLSDTDIISRDSLALQRAQSRMQLEKELTKSNYSENVQSLILECFDHKLSSLNLESMQLNNIPSPSILAKLASHVININLYHNNISRIDAQAFATLPNLQEINLSFNEIGEIDSQAFKGCTNLCVLDLNSNNLTTIKRELIPLDNLQLLNLSENSIENIYGDAFVRNSSLKHLDLSGNNKLNSDQAAAAVSKLKSLKDLNLNGTPLFGKLHLAPHDITYIGGGFSTTKEKGVKVVNGINSSSTSSSEPPTFMAGGYFSMAAKNKSTNSIDKGNFTKKTEELESSIIKIALERNKIKIKEENLKSISRELISYKNNLLQLHNKIKQELHKNGILDPDPIIKDLDLPWLGLDQNVAQISERVSSIINNYAQVTNTRHEQLTSNQSKEHFNLVKIICNSKVLLTNLVNQLEGSDNERYNIARQMLDVYLKIASHENNIKHLKLV